MSNCFFSKTSFSQLTPTSFYSWLLLPFIPDSYFLLFLIPTFFISWLLLPFIPDSYFLLFLTPTFFISGLLRPTFPDSYALLFLTPTLYFSWLLLSSFPDSYFLLCDSFFMINSSFLLVLLFSSLLPPTFPHSCFLLLFCEKHNICYVLRLHTSFSLNLFPIRGGLLLWGKRGNAPPSLVNFVATFASSWQFAPFSPLWQITPFCPSLVIFQFASSLTSCPVLFTNVSSFHNHLQK